VIVFIYQRIDVVVGAIHSGQSIAPSAWVVHVQVAPAGEFVTDGENVPSALAKRNRCLRSVLSTSILPRLNTSRALYRCIPCRLSLP
jgi:hypothetical protein